MPEIYEGIVRIEAAAREPGARSKIAVVSKDSDVDPVGACVGMRGSRVQAVVQELRGEKIDIVPWSADPVRYVVAALAPAQVVRIMVDDEKRSMDVIVPDDQLSLAIGKKGQNVRLAVQLTRWKIDIKSETYMRAVQAELASALSVVPEARRVRGQAPARPRRGEPRRARGSGDGAAAVDPGNLGGRRGFREGARARARGREAEAGAGKPRRLRPRREGGDGGATGA